MTDLHPCLGLFGQCLYDPAKPSLVYFSIGEAIAALALTFAFQLFLSPLYVFRLRAYGLKIVYFIIPMFWGFLCTVIAALLPSLPVSHRHFWSYPIVWEVFGAVPISLSFLGSSFILFRPARIYKFNLTSFLHAAATLLTEADDAMRVSLADELLAYHRNVERLIRYAWAWELTERHESWIELERLGNAGLQRSFTGRPPISAFYRFAHRKELSAASEAGTFLRILSDSHFCSVLVRRSPWLVAGLIYFLSRKKLYTGQMKLFIQEIGRQSAINEESIISKELGYEGFGATPYLSNTLFGDWFILRNYDPLRGLQFARGAELTSGYLSRLGGVSKLIIQTAIKNKEFWHVSYVDSIGFAYEHVFSDLSYKRYKGISVDSLVSLEFGVRDLYKELDKALSNMKIEDLQAFYAVKERLDDWEHLVAQVAELVDKSLESIANSFQGYEDPTWSHAITMFMDIFPSIGQVPIGLNPLQQQLALRLVEKLKQNMQGYYPAISRVLLSTIGRYERNDQVSRFSAFGILRDAVYKELQKLKDLHRSNPDRFDHFLPPHIKYDPDTDTLTFTYRLSDPATTDLSSLVIADVNLLDPRHRAWIPQGDGMGWVQ